MEGRRGLCLRQRPGWGVEAAGEGGRTSITEASASGAAGEFVAAAPSPSLWGSPTLVEPERRRARKPGRLRGRGCPERPARLQAGRRGRDGHPLPLCLHPLVLNQGQLHGGKPEPGEVGKRPPRALRLPAGALLALGLLALGLLAGRKDRYPGALPAGVSPAHDARSRLPSHCADDGQWSLSPFLPPSLSFLLSFNIACDYSP